MRLLIRLRSLLIVCVMAGLFLRWSFPDDCLPSPTGPYHVGTMSLLVTDTARKDPFSPHRADLRNIPVQVWYPTDAAKGERAPYMVASSDVAPFLKATLFAILASHLNHVHTSALSKAPISGKFEKFPVLVFSHGLMGGRIQNTVQAQEFASHGYIVVAPDHEYDASFAIRPGGKIVTSQLLAGRSTQDCAHLADCDIAERAADVQTVASVFKRGQIDPICKKMDWSHAGIFGHSLGGRTALCSCMHGDLFRAGISMDGATADPSPLRCPFLFMDAYRAGDPLGVKRLNSVAAAHLYHCRLLGSEHANFTDLPLITPMHWVAGLSGKIPQDKAESAINSNSLRFFDYYLKGIGEDGAPSSDQYCRAMILH